jgi:hypothetical protein
VAEAHPFCRRLLQFLELSQALLEVKELARAQLEFQPQKLTILMDLLESQAVLVSLVHLELCLPKQELYLKFHQPTRHLSVARLVLL